MSTTTPIGLEFFKDARGTVTHVNRSRRCGSRTEGGPQERRGAGQMRRVIPVSAVLLTAAATVSAQTGAWLGQPMTAWNAPAAAVPASGIGISSQAALERRCGSASAGTAVSSDA